MGIYKFLLDLTLINNLIVQSQFYLQRRNFEVLRNLAYHSNISYLWSR